MGKLSEKFPEELRQAHIDRSLGAGSVIYVHCRFTDPPKNKYLLAACREPERKWSVMPRLKPRQRPSDSKLRDLILYICLRCEADASFGSIKLNKLLFFSDFLAYRHFGESITGQPYQALQWGPAPKRMKPVLESMKAKGLLAIRETDFYGRPEQKPLALAAPAPDRFDSEQTRLVDGLIQHFRGTTGRNISELSHGFVGWQLAQELETIPYSVALISGREPTLAERERGRELEPMAEECLARHAS